MPDFPDYGIALGTRSMGGMVKPPAGVMTPSFNGKRPLPSAGGDLDTSTNDAYDPSQMTPATQQYLDLIQHPVGPGQTASGQPISTGRKVLGVLSQLGGFAGLPTPMFTDQIMNPGQRDWQGKVARAQMASELEDKALDRQARLENIRSLQEQRKASAEAREQTTYANQIKDKLPVESQPLPPSPLLDSPDTFRQGKDNMANVNLPQMRTTVPAAIAPGGLPPSPALQNVPEMLRPNAPALPNPSAPGPQTAGIPGNIGQQIEPETGLPLSQAGTIMQVRRPGGGTEQWLRPNPSTVATLAANKAKATRSAALEAAQDNWVTVPDTPEMKAAFAPFGKKVGDKVDPETYKAVIGQYVKPEKPEPASAAKQAFQATMTKLAAEGTLGPDALTNVSRTVSVIRGSKTLTPEEKSSAIAYLAANPTPAMQGTNITLRTEATEAAQSKKADIAAKQAALKLYEPAQSSAERLNIMTKNYEDAVKNHDQQAMLSLLANHLGMTMGLQKGARLNQAIINEAAKSSPLIQSIAAKFDKDGYLSGVTLTPEQMRQMVSLGRERFAEDVSKARSSADYMGITDDGPARKPGQATMNHYVGLANGDLNKAKQLAQADGWTVQ